MSDEIQKLEEAIAQLEDERDDLEVMFQKVAPTKPDTLRGAKFLFLKYGEQHRERLIDIKLEIVHKRTELKNIKEK
jgi:hypothetical protein